MSRKCKKLSRNVMLIHFVHNEFRLSLLDKINPIQIVEDQVFRNMTLSHKAI